MNIFVGCSSEKFESNLCKNSLALIEKISTIPNLNLVFGAYNHGMMGYIYNIYKKNKKEVYGITLNIYKEQLKNLNCDKTELVNTTMDRMKKIYEKSDILLFLPGGIGTYEEILSSIEESRTKEDNKLLILYNDNFFFTPFIKEFYKLFEDKLVKKPIGEYIQIESNIEEIYKLIEKEIKK